MSVTFYKTIGWFIIVICILLGIGAASQSGDFSLAIIGVASSLSGVLFLAIGDILQELRRR